MYFAFHLVTVLLTSDSVGRQGVCITVLIMAAILAAGRTGREKLVCWPQHAGRIKFALHMLMVRAPKVAGTHRWFLLHQTFVVT